LVIRENYKEGIEGWESQ